MTTLEIIRPIIESTYAPTYGSTPSVRALARCLAERIDAEGMTQDQVQAVCWNWFSGGGIAADAARQITEALNAQRPTQEAILTAEELERVASDRVAQAALLRARAGALRRA